MVERGLLRKLGRISQWNDLMREAETVSTDANEGSTKLHYQST